MMKRLIFLTTATARTRPVTTIAEARNLRLTTTRLGRVCLTKRATAEYSWHKWPVFVENPSYERPDPDLS